MKLVVKKGMSEIVSFLCFFLFEVGLFLFVCGREYWYFFGFVKFKFGLCKIDELVY